MPIPIKKPRKIEFSPHPAASEVGQLVSGIIVKAIAKSTPNLNKIVQRFSEARIAKLTMLAEEAGEVFTDYMHRNMSAMAFTYLACRTDFAVIKNDRQEDISFNALEDQFVELERLMGKKAAAEVLRVLTYNIDAVLEETFGRQL